ncbi:UNVERIFIED_CONTAM: hypothetical protein Sradi_6215400 [Sesamum radiatum]|uniref:Uncharacterized protein n=1 Tax=Sesamum radiatum TaxID=300843 RepID=A0AAW2KC92_SESRA
MSLLFPQIFFCQIIQPCWIIVYGNGVCLERTIEQISGAMKSLHVKGSSEVNSGLVSDLEEDLTNFVPLRNASEDKSEI